MQSCEWLNVTTEGGMSQVLKRLRISYKRGRDYVHSPDPDYERKRELIEQVRRGCQAEPERFV